MPERSGASSRVSTLPKKAAEYSQGNMVDTSMPVSRLVGYPMKACGGLHTASLLPHSGCEPLVPSSHVASLLSANSGRMIKSQ